jgi:hypothetical protein
MSRLLIVFTVALACLAALAGTASARTTRVSVSNFSFSPSTFSVAPGGAKAASSQRATSISFRLSRAATVRIAIARKLSGRRATGKSAGRCVKATAKLSSRPACSRFVAAGKITRGGLKAGTRSIGFSGRIHGHALASGTYRARIRAIGRHGAKSRLRTATFRITRASTGASTPAPAPAPAPAPPPAPRGFPTPSTTGVPAGWVPAQTRTGAVHITQNGAVVQDMLIQGDLDIEADNVTVRRVDIQGGMINNQPGAHCGNGLVIEDTTIEPPPGVDFTKENEGVISYGGYTARRVKIWRRSEGFRVSGKSAGCGPVTIEDSFAKIVDGDDCNLHADGLQGYDGNALTVTNTTIDGTDIGCGTAPFFVPAQQGNTSANVNQLLVMGAGYPFRLGVPGSVQGLKIVNKSWVYGPIAVMCGLMSTWDAQLVTITPDYQVASVVGPQRCNTNDS